MKRASTLGIIFVLLLTWLASPPPARACSPRPYQPAIIPAFRIDLSESTLQLLSKPDVSFIEIRNDSYETFFLLGQSELENLEPIIPSGFTLPEGYLAYHSIKPFESLLLTQFQIFSLSEEIVGTDGMFSFDKPETIILPEPEQGNLVFGMGDQLIIVPVSVSYHENSDWIDTSNWTCSGYFVRGFILLGLVYFCAPVLGSLAVISLIVFIVRAINRKIASIS